MENRKCKKWVVTADWERMGDKVDRKLTVKSLPASMEILCRNNNVSVTKKKKKKQKRKKNKKKQKNSPYPRNLMSR